MCLFVVPHGFISAFKLLRFPLPQVSCAYQSVLTHNVLRIVRVGEAATQHCKTCKKAQQIYTDLAIISFSAYTHFY